MTTVDDVKKLMEPPASGGTTVQSVLDALGTAKQAGPADVEFKKGPGLQDFLARGGMSMLADTTVETYDVFKKYYPKGDLFRRQDDQEYYFNTQQGEPYQKVDPSIFSDEGRMADIPYDIADVAGALPALSGELLGFALTKNPGALGNTLTAMAGAGAGELLRQGAQFARGTQRETPAAIAARVGTEALTAGAGEAAVKPVIGLVNAVRGGASFALKEGAERALQAMERQGLPSISSGQAMLNPLVARWEGMGKTMSSGFIKLLQDQKQKALAGLRKVADSPDRGVSKITQAVRAAENKIMARIKRAPVGSDRAGREILLGVEEWDVAARAVVDAKYDAARKAGPAIYEITDLKTAADDIIQGVRGRVQEADREVGTGILDEFGREVMKTEVTSSTIRLSKLNPEVRDVAQKILDLDPEIPTVNGIDATEQLKVLRNRLWDAKTPSAGEPFTQKHRDANILYNALTDAMNNPASDEGAMALWREAAGEASRRFGVLDKAVVGQILKTQKRGGESAVAQMLMQGGKESDIKFIRGLVGAERFSVLKDYAAGEILRKPSLLASMDQDVLFTLFPAREMQHISGIVDDLAKLRASDFAKTMDDNLGLRRGVLEFINSGTPAQVKAFIAATKNDPVALAEVKRIIIDSMTDAAKQGGGFNRGAFNSAVKSASDNGLMRIFSPTEMTAINDFRRYIKFTAETSTDPGTSMMAAQVTSPPQFATGNKPVMNVLGEMIHQISITVGLGRFLTSKAGARILRGTGKAPKRYRTIRALAATAATLVNDQQRKEDEP